MPLVSLVSVVRNLGKNSPMPCKTALSLSASIPMRSAMRVSLRPTVMKSFAMSNLPSTTLRTLQMFAGIMPVLTSSSAAIAATDACAEAVVALEPRMLERSSPSITP